MQSTLLKRFHQEAFGMAQPIIRLVHDATASSRSELVQSTVHVAGSTILLEQLMS